MQTTLINRDYAYLDVRSVTAMLRGTGDGREEDYLHFASQHPQLDGAQLVEAYHQRVRYRAPMPHRTKRMLLWGSFYFCVIEPLGAWMLMQYAPLRTYLPF